MGLKALVTGGAGFIGSHIVDALIQEGHQVAVIDSLRTGKRENVNKQARLYEVDICDAEALARVFAAESPSVVFHEAALANVRVSLEHPDEYAETNVIGTLRLLEACRQHGVSKFVFASTGGAIYGEVTGGAATEETPAHPVDPYGVSKLASEHYLFSYQHNYGLAYSVLRYSNVYGPRQDSQGEAGVVAIFTDRMLSGQPTVINGTGKQQRDFVFVGDVARANLLAIQAESGIYNIGTGVATDINQVFQALAELTHYPHPEVHGPTKPGEVLFSCLNASRARHVLGWEPQVTLMDGLAQTVDYFRTRRP